MERIAKFLWLLFCIFTAMIGYEKHNSVFWAIVDFLFAPFVWIKWLIFKEVNLTLIKETFLFLFQ